MFKKAVIRMTLVYLLILMTISLFFSLALYRISKAEIQGSLNRQQRVIERMGPFMHEFLDDPTLLQQRNQDLISANNRIIWELIYTNIVILVVGGGLSYLLARLTLEPIEKSHEAQVRFTGDASHELRSPLASMKTEIEVALRDPNLTKEEAVDILKSNLEEVERLGILSDYLLKLARDDDVLKIEKINLSKLVSEVIGTKNVLVKEKKIKIVNEVDSNILVFANSESVREILSILADNALQYSDAGKQIWINAISRGGQVEVSVKDEGIGIAEKDQACIFERFYQADGSRTKGQSKGYGLGLALAQKLAEKNQTKIVVTSKLGKGSTFSFRLPIKNRPA